MATTITVMSWNIESLGDAKAAITPSTGAPLSKSQIVNFIAAVAKGLNIDVLGIMEVKSGIGPKLCLWLLSQLNNNNTTAGTTWKGVVSSRQDGGTMEEYLYFWKSSATFDINMAGLPGPSSLINVADVQAFEGLFQGTTIAKNKAAQEQFLQALKVNGYLINGSFKVLKSMKSTETLRVNPNIWQAMQSGTTPVAFNLALTPNPPITFKPAQLLQISQILAQLDVLRFISYGDRSPYLINLNLDTKTLVIALFHAPGPGDLNRFPAINNIGLSMPLANTNSNMLLMGDFNIAEDKLKKRGLVYQRTPVNTSAVKFEIKSPRQLVTVYNPITGAPLNTNNALLPAPSYTSLVHTYLSNTATIGETEANIYDNFYFRQSLTATNQLSVVANSAKIALPLGTYYPAGTGFNRAFAVSVFDFFQVFRGATFLQDVIDGLEEKEAPLSTAANKKKAIYLNAQKNLNTAIGNGANAKTLSTLNSRVKTAFATYTKENNKLLKVTNAIASVKVTLTLVKNPISKIPAGIGDALTIYRHAISDHLPISFQLQS